MSSGTNILHLPDDLLLLIAQNVSGQDLLNFALTCQRFSSVCAYLRKLNFGDAYNIFPADMARFFKTTLNCSKITECLFENCYWIPAEILSDAIQECVNVSVLRVANTRLSHQHLTKVFSKCPLIRVLSFSIKNPELWVPPNFDESMVDLLKNGQSLKEAFELTELRGYSRIFNQLVKLDLYMTADVFLFVTLLRACESLESMCVTTFGAEEYEDVDGNLDLIQHLFPEEFKPPGSLTSLVLFFESSWNNCYTFEGGLPPPKPIGSNYELNIVHDEATVNISHQEDFLEDIINNGYPLKCAWSKDLSYSVKRVSNSKLYTSNSSNQGYFIDNVESIKDYSYMCSNHICPEVKFVDCCYDRKEFAKFCRGHLQLRKLRLRLEDIDDGEPTGLHEFNSLSNLRHLTRLSIDVNILVGAANNRGGRGGIDQPCAVLAELVKCSLPLEELEILKLERESVFIPLFTMSSSDLSLIGQLRLLKKLSLGKFRVDGGQFLVDILGKCSMLESLKLDTFHRDIFSYARTLCTALPLASNLKLLRLVLDISEEMWPMGEVLDAVSKCTSLVQLYLIAPSFTKPFEIAELSAKSFSDKIIKLVCSLNNLLCLHCYMNVPQSQCAAATKVLVETVALKRPSLCVELLSQQVYDMHVTSLPFVHSRHLIDIREEFSSLPYEGDD